MGTAAPGFKQSCTQSSFFCLHPHVLLMSYHRVQDLDVMVHHLHHHSTQHQPQCRTITLTLDRPTWGDTASTRTPTAIRWRQYTTRRLRKLTRFRDASQGRTGCAIPRMILTLLPRMTTNAATWRRQIATWRRRRSTTSLAQTPLNSIVSARRLQRMTAMDRRL